MLYLAINILKDYRFLINKLTNDIFSSTNIPDVTKNTLDFTNIAIEAKLLRDIQTDAGKKKKANDLYEKVMYSDPVRVEELADEEDAILQEIKVLKDRDFTQRDIDKIIILIDSRNEKCKLYK